MKGNIIVTGANGFVGKLLCEELIDRGYNVYGLVRNESVELPSRVMRLVYSEITNLKDFREYFTKSYAVIHLAAKVHVKNSNEIEEYRHINTAGTTHLANMAASEGVEKFIYLSTIKVNGDNTGSTPYSIDSIPQPLDAYAVSKWEAEQELMEIHKNTDMDIAILRPVLMYGSGVKGNLHTLMKVVSTGIPLPLKKINNQRSFLNVRNLNDLICQCLENGNSAGRTFLVSDGHDLSTTELVRLTASSLGMTSKLFSVPSGFMRMVARVFGKTGIYERLYGSLQVDIEETKNILGWTPPYNVQDGIHEMTNDFKNKSAQV